MWILMMIKKYKFPVLIIFLLLLSHITSVGQSDTLQVTQSMTAKLLFLSDEPLNIIVEANFKEIKEDRDQERSYHPATLRQVVGNDTIVLPIRLKTRGNFRLKCENCDFPPLKFKFEKESVHNTVFEGQRKLKMVTHCRNRSDRLQACTIKEYLSYKAYNLISEFSFKVRLVNITYVDTGDENNALRKVAFFIEDKADMASRNGMDEMKVANIHQLHTNYYKMAELAIFQYMIGNTDWSVPKLHNIILLKKETHSPPIAVPYDFDWAGLVNAPYAKPAPQVDAFTVKQRVYRGYKRPLDEMGKPISKFIDVKTSMMDLFIDFDYLELKEKQKCIKYINDFYNIIESKSTVRRELVSAARSK